MRGQGGGRLTGRRMAGHTFSLNRTYRTADAHSRTHAFETRFAAWCPGVDGRVARRSVSPDCFSWPQPFPFQPFFYSASRSTSSFVYLLFIFHSLSPALGKVVFVVFFVHSSFCLFLSVVVLISSLLPLHLCIPGIVLVPVRSLLNAIDVLARRVRVCVYVPCLLPKRFVL